MQKKKLTLAKQIGLALLAGIAIGAALWAIMGAEAAGAFTTQYIKPFGDIFVNLLKFVVVPVVLLSLIDGMISMKDIRKAGAVGGKTLLFFAGTTIIACIIGLSIANLFLPLFPVLAHEETLYTAPEAISLMDTLVGIFPSNAFEPLVSANMLQIIVIALFVGSGIILSGEKGQLAADTVKSFYDVIMQVMGFIIRLAPFGVLALITWVVSTQGPQILTDLAIVLLCAYIGFFLHAVIVFSATVKVFANMNPLRFFKGILPAFIFAFSSTSSIATLPVSKKCCDELGVNGEVSSFVLPLGATINMNGTAIYQCVAVVFLAKCAGIDLALTEMILVIVTATLASVGTAGVAGAGMIMLAMVLDAVGIPTTYIGIIYGVDRLFDMGRTAMNSVGDTACAVCVGALEDKKNLKNSAKTAAL